MLVLDIIFRKYYIRRDALMKRLRNDHVDIYEIIIQSRESIQVPHNCAHFIERQRDGTQEMTHL